MNEHTLGPWIVKGFKWIEGEEGDGIWSEAEEDWIVLPSIDYENRGIDHPSDALLIATAPDMLHELRVLEQDLRNLANSALTGEYKTIAINSARRAQALIEKATNELTTKNT